MKKIIVTLFFVLALSYPALAAEINTSTATEQMQIGGTVTGGSNSITFNSGSGKNESTVFSNITTYTNIDLLMAPRAIYNPGDGWKLWNEYNFIDFQSLYSAQKELKQIRKEDGVIIQTSGRKTLANNTDGIFILSDRPENHGRDELKVLQYDAPANGLLKESIIRALSLSKEATQMRHAFILVRKIINPQATSHGQGMNTGSSSMIGDLAQAASGAIQSGRSESKVYEINQITVYCYKRPIFKTRQFTQKKAKKLPTIFIENNIINKNDLEENYAWLRDNWKSIRKEKKQIVFTGFGANIAQARQCAYNSMISIGRKLASVNIPPNEISETLSFKAEISNPNQLKAIHNKNSEYAVTMNKQ